MAQSTETPRKKGLRPIHLLFFVLFICVRSSSSTKSPIGSVMDQIVTQSPGSANTVDKQVEDLGGHGTEHKSYEIFHMDFARVQIPFIIALWIFVSSLAKIGFHMTPVLPTIFPESCLLIFLGTMIGLLLLYASKTVPTLLTPDIFFLFMLPPIIFDAGYFMPNRLFFDHLGTILLMAVVGTIFNVLTIGVALWGCGRSGIFGEDPPNILEMLLFSSLISAVDPVAVLAVFEEIHIDDILYIVVFGESLLNDAVTVVLYRMFEAYNEMGQSNIEYTDILGGLASFLVVALGGTVVGIIWGYITAFVTRFTNHARILEPIFVFTMAYLSYLNAEIFHMSGILAITFCGITMKNYVERNISTKSQTTLKYATKMLSGSSETIIFMFLGVATIDETHTWNTAFVLLTILFCSVFRIIGVLLLSSLANNYRLHKLKAVDQFVMMYGGLRGAVAFALVLLIDAERIPHAPMFRTTTIAVVYFTVFVQGITIKPLVKYLNVKTSSEKEPTMNERIAGRFMDHIVTGIEGILGEFGNLRIRDTYKRFDAKYIKPCLLRDNHAMDHKIIETFENLTNKDVAEYMKRNPTQFAGLSNMDGANPIAPSLTEGQSMSTAGDNWNNNLDLKECSYTTSMKDMTETKIHHVLSENLFMPRARPRRMSYSRHAVDEKDIAFNHDINFKVHMQVRRMMSENQMRKRKRPKVADKKHMRVLGSSKQLRDDHVHQIIKETVHEEDEHSRSSDDDDAGISFAPKGTVANGIINPAYMKDISEKYEEESDDNEEPSLKADLPWKRETDNKVCIAPVKQREFPTWINNNEYIKYGSPSEVFIGDAHSTEPQTVIEFYDKRRDSSTSIPGSNSRRSSENRIKPPTIYKRRNSHSLTFPESQVVRVNFEDEINR
ncbi:sodium/hydrogen exchanger 3 isoform X2 [Lepeophtheirus salmonis]|uniref:sodium/hydrogen exchanger 3 isoform X2 n=1 Tax=Lepeophtheirus salmonis TaxID=72036 RepID=UPI003AF3EFD7